tara:strand:- start:147 stop:302 length:156 start_codon:yes stop_codon:yes gene_type:complete
MRIVLKLLFGLGKKENFEINFYTLLFTAVSLGGLFFGSIVLFLYMVLTLAT